MALLIEPHPLSDIREVTWQLSHEGNDHIQEARYAINNVAPELLVVTGFGETNIETVAQLLGEQGVMAAVCNISYPEKISTGDVRLTPDLMEQTILHSLAAIIHDMNKRAGRAIDTPINMVGHSKGFGELLKFVTAYPDTCNRLAGAAPLGANCIPEIMGTDAREYSRTFGQRLRASGLLAALGNNINTGRLLDEFRAGVQYVQREDCPGMIKRLARLGILKHVVVGEDDAICPPEECRAVSGSELEIIVTAGQHDIVTSPLGLHQLTRAIDSCLSS